MEHQCTCRSLSSGIYGMQGRGQQVELHLGMLHLNQLHGVDVPAHVSLRPNCGP